MNDTVKSAAETALQARSDDALRIPCYCEENVWRLAHRKLNSSDNNRHYYAVFVSNPEKCVPMFYQLAATNPQKPCFWDYHVILISKGGEQGTLVHDIDSHLPYPCPLLEYLQSSFPDIDTCPEEYAPMFRVVQAAQFLGRFGSDRMHMFDSKTKTWSATPPAYPCIESKAPEKENNLMTYMTMTVEDILENATVKEDNPFGVVYTLPQLLSRFSEPEPS